LGSGLVSIVKLAKDKIDNKFYAIKIVNIINLINPNPNPLD